MLPIMRLCAGDGGGGGGGGELLVCFLRSETIACSSGRNLPVSAKLAFCTGFYVRRRDALREFNAVSILVQIVDIFRGFLLKIYHSEERCWSALSARCFEFWMRHVTLSPLHGTGHESTKHAGCSFVRHTSIAVSGRISKYINEKRSLLSQLLR